MPKVSFENFKDKGTLQVSSIEDTKIVDIKQIEPVAKGIWKTINYHTKTVTVLEENIGIEDNIISDRSN